MTKQRCESESEPAVTADPRFPWERGCWAVEEAGGAGAAGTLRAASWTWQEGVLQPRTQPCACLADLPSWFLASGEHSY